LKYLISIFLLTSLGCTTVGITPYEKDVEARPKNCEFQVYFEPEDVNSPFEVTCDISSQVQNLPWDPSTRVVAWTNARAHLCAQGAEHVIVKGWLGSWLRDKMDVVVIKVKDEKTVAKGMTYDVAMELFVCRDQGGTWQAGSCQNIMNDPYGNTKNAMRHKVLNK
jgi:hypothetical protein